MTATTIIRGFEIEAVVVFILVAWRVRRDWSRAGVLPLLGCLFVGSLVVALVGDPIANWGLTALYSDTFHLLPRVMGLGLSPAQSWACVFAYPWCFPMMAYGGRALANFLGGNSAIAGFIGGALVGGTMFVLSVPITFVPHQVIVYQQAPPWPLTLFAGTPGQVQLLDVFGVSAFIGLVTALIMPASVRSYLERMLPARTWGRVAFSCVLLPALFILSFSPALAVRALGLDTAVGFTRSPFPTVPLYGQVEAYPEDLIANFMTNCRVRSDQRRCECALDAVRRRFTLAEYYALEKRLLAGEASPEMSAVIDDCRY
jgi:hypothetical protein